MELHRIGVNWDASIPSNFVRISLEENPEETGLLRCRVFISINTVYIALNYAHITSLQWAWGLCRYGAVSTDDSDDSCVSGREMAMSNIDGQSRMQMNRSYTRGDGNPKCEYKGRSLGQAEHGRQSMGCYGNKMTLLAFF